MKTSDYIYRAFRKCGQMRPGYSNSADLLADGLAEFQALFDAWNARRTMQYTQPDYVYPVTGPGHGTTGNGQTFGGAGFTIGPTATDFQGQRPEKIARMNLYMTSASPTNPTRIPLPVISMEEWTSIAAPVLQAVNVTMVAAYDPQFPNGVIWVWPPLNGNSLEIFTWGFLTPPATLDDVLAFPPGYQDAIDYSLAERVWPLCTNDVMPHKLSLQYVAGKAAKARQALMDVNAAPPRVACDFGGARGSSASTNDWGLIFTGRPY